MLFRSETAADGILEARTSDNTVIRVPGDGVVGQWRMVEITAARGWMVEGRLTEE